MPLLQGVLADREAWSSVGHCSIEKTMSVLGTKSAMLIMREAYYGTTRFDDFAQRVGITKAAASARLSELVDLGLSTRQLYRSRGSAPATSTCSPKPASTSCPWCGRCSNGVRRHLPGRNRLRLTHLDCGAERRSRSAAPKAIRCRSTNSAWSWPGGAGATTPEPASLKYSSTEFRPDSSRPRTAPMYTTVIFTVRSCGRTPVRSTKLERSCGRSTSGRRRQRRLTRRLHP